MRGLSQLLRRPEDFVVIIAFGVIAIAIAALIGWRLANDTLTSVVPGAVALQPMTGVALIVGSIGLLAATCKLPNISRLAGVVLLATCVVWLSAYALARELPIDLLIFRTQVLAQKPAPLWPGRPSIITCSVVASFAISLLGMGARRSQVRLAAVGAASVGVLLASTSLLPFLLQDASQLAIRHQGLRIALNTSVGLGALCIGVLILKRDTGWVKLVAGGGERGRIARLLTPVALVPIGLGTIANLGVRFGVYGPDVRMLVIIVLDAVALLFLAFWAAQMLGNERSASDGLTNALERSTVMIVDAEGKIRHWAPACETLYGWTAKEVLGRRPDEFLDVEAPCVAEARRAAIHETGEWRGEVRHFTKTGDVRWVALQWVRQPGNSDREERVIGTISDITDLKLAEASLRESQERLRLAVDAYDLGIADADIVSRTLIADAGFERLLALPPGGLKGGVDMLNAMVVAANPHRDADIAAHKAQQLDDVRMRRADGEIRDFHGVRRFFYGPDGAHIRTIGIYRDVTEELQARHELALRGDHLAQLRSELAHVTRLSTMGEMAAALAHELNQPLTAIGNSVGALKIMLGDGSGALDEVARGRVVRAANQAETQAVRAGEIVRRLRDFIARGEADARIEELDRLIEDAVALGAPNAKADGMEIRYDFSPKAGCIIADRIQIQQIVVNLVRNAVEAMRDAPRPHVLEISTLAKRGMVEVSVHDNGPGISPEFAKQLFSPFLSTKSDGMGVGLSICRRIVEAHGGRMWLEESYGSGADFRFTVPLATKERRHA